MRKYSYAIPDIPEKDRRVMAECGHKGEEAQELWERSLFGDFRTGDIIVISKYTIIDWKNSIKDENYGRVHSLWPHYYLVVGENRETVREGSFEATSDIQLVLLDGVHMENSKGNRYNNEHRDIRIKLREKFGLPGNFYANAERLIFGQKEDLLERGAVIRSYVAENYRNVFSRVKNAAYEKGREKSNTYNMKYTKSVPER